MITVDIGNGDNVELSQEEYDQFLAAAQRLGRTVGSCVREAWDMWIEEGKPPLQ